jgi:hypothetical protein
LHHVELAYVTQETCQEQLKSIFDDYYDESFWEIYWEIYGEEYYGEEYTLEEFKEMAGNIVIGDDQICAADPGQDSCQGDSGGPLYDKDNGVVVGVVSWGIGKGTDLYYLFWMIDSYLHSIFSICLHVPVSMF